MSYMALARRYRPRTFDQVLGQESVVRALSNALDADKLHHALLLTGTRGVGKTTLARILAKALNCETGVSSTPCGTCSACVEVDEGRFVDLLEIDAASRTKVDDTRAMLDNVQYAPVRGRYKIYLIDEVHMLSGHSFNALLKTLEEPPEHVKFVLATTDPQKLPVTVLSRCLQLHLRALPEATIRTLLRQVLDTEGRPADDEGLALLAQAADGSMRDALSLLDQSLAHAGDATVSADTVSAMLGLDARSGILDALVAIARDDAAALSAQLDALATLAVDHSALLDDTAAMLQATAFTQALPGRGADADDLAARTLAPLLDPADVQLFYDMAVHARRDLPWAPSARAGFEMALLRMWTFRRQAHDAGSAPTDSDSEATAAPAVPAAGAAAAGETVDMASAVEAAGTAPPATETAGAVPLADAAVADCAAWEARIDAAALEAFTRELARNCTPAEESEALLRLHIARDMAHLQNEERLASLQASFGKPVVIEVQPTLDALTPAERARRERAEVLRKAHRQLADSPVAQALSKHFGASVSPDDVRLMH